MNTLAEAYAAQPPSTTRTVVVPNFAAVTTGAITTTLLAQGAIASGEAVSVMEALFIGGTVASGVGGLVILSVAAGYAAYGATAMQWQELSDISSIFSTVSSPAGFSGYLLGSTKSPDSAKETGDIAKAIFDLKDVLAAGVKAKDYLTSIDLIAKALGVPQAIKDISNPFIHNSEDSAESYLGDYAQMLGAQYKEFLINGPQGDSVESRPGLGELSCHPSDDQQFYGQTSSSQDEQLEAERLRMQDERTERQDELREEREEQREDEMP